VDELAGSQEARRIILNHVVMNQALLSESVSEETIVVSTASPVEEDVLELSTK